MIKNDELLEYALVYEQYKGIPKSRCETLCVRKKMWIMRIDVQGAATIP